MKNRNIKYKVLSFLILMIVFIGTLDASSHREAPLISSDPLADNVDVYAFRSPDNPDMVTLIATYVPFQLPHGGPNYSTFGENIRYEIHIDNDAAIVGDEVTYRFTFKIENEDPTTFFNIRLGKQNQKATYTLERSLDGGQTFEIIVENGVVPPNNIGDRSITGAAGLNSDYNTLWGSAITTATTGETVFAGPSDDPFFVDLGGIFDLGDAPRQNGTPVDGVACYNVSTLAIQVPISTLLKNGAPEQPENILDPNYVIGVWASSSRPAITTLSSGSNPAYSGDWVQVSRLGMPLTNEAVIPIGDKDYWNAITPYDELADTRLDEYFYNPELALYMDDDLFGGAVPAFGPLRIQKASLGAFDFTNGADGVSALAGGDLTGTAFEVFGDLLLIPEKPRSVDLWPIFHTGVPNAIPYQLATGKAGNPLAAGKPFINNFLPNGGDMLRLNMAVPPTPRDDSNFSSLGLVQAAAIGLTVEPFNTTADLEFIPNMDGFPNGRRLEDDVTRIELQAVGGIVLAAIGLWYDDYDPLTSPSPVTQDLLDVLTYSTGVEENDKKFGVSFPYVAQPHSGTGDCSGEIQETSPLDEDIASQFFVSSNTQSAIGLFNVFEDGTITTSMFESMAADADGIYFDRERDVVYQLNRTDNVVQAYSMVLENLNKGEMPVLTATSSSDFINGREIAVVGDKLIVAQDANDDNEMVNKLLTYSISPTEITLEKENEVSIDLWGIHATQNNVYAIVDNSNKLAVFEKFFEQEGGLLEASRTIEVEGIIRTHGITFIQDLDMMILTDVGSGMIADDGAFSIIAQFTSKSGDDMITTDEQRNVSGSNTFLGNPVDVAFDRNLNTVFIAERANKGGRVLGFSLSAVGNASPMYDEPFLGASAIYIDNKRDPIVLPDLDVFDPNFSDDFLISARMSGGNEVPAVMTDAIGVATVTFNEDYTQAIVNATVSNLSSPFTGVHIHAGLPGENGDVLFNLSDDYNSGRLQSVIDVTSENVANFVEGKYYINLHTESKPGGELRGNLSLEAAESFVTILNGGQEVPEVEGDGQGVAAVHYTSNTNTLEINILVTDLTGPITGIHLHNGSEGENGDVVQNLTPSLVGNSMRVKMQAGDYIEALRNEDIYINVHTAANPSGEIRGQLAASDGLVFDSWMAGSQEVPANDAIALGLGIGELTSDLSGITTAILVDNRSGDLTGAHFHNAGLNENGGVVLNLSDFIDGPLILNEEELDVDESLVSAFLSGDLYLNVHSGTYPSGEVRGQVYRIARDGYAYDLCQEQEVDEVVDAGDASGSGMFAFNRDFDEAHMMVVVNQLGSEFQGAHIHNGAPEEAGPVVFNLTDRWNNNGTFFYIVDEFTSELADLIQLGNAYVNVHTTNNPSGEVRGQIVKRPNCPLPTSIIEIDGNQSFEVRLYPNPVSDLLYLEFFGDELLYDKAVLSISDISGRVVMTDSVTSTKNQISTEELEEGIYVLTLKNNTFIHSIKFIKI